MKKIFYISALIIFVMAFFVALAGKVNFIGDRFIVSDSERGTSGGDLYNFSKYEGVREQMSLMPSYEYDFDKCDIIAMGDSFFGSSWDTKRIPDQLTDKLEESVCFIKLSQGYFPIKKMQEMGLSDGEQRKTLILETVERKVSERFTGELLKESDFLENVESGAAVIKNKNKLKDFTSKIFENNGVEYFFRNNIFVDKIRSKIMHYKFEFFSETVPQIGAYSRNKDILYYAESLKEKNVDDIESQIDVLEKLKSRLDEFNFDLILVVVPDKITIHNDDVEKYNSTEKFLQAFSVAIRLSGVEFVDVYPEFLQQAPSEMLYYRGDTHVNEKGKSILIDLIIEKLNEQQ